MEENDCIFINSVGFQKSCNIDIRNPIETNIGQKNHKIIYFPFENLDLNSYVKGYNSKNEFVYDLYAICNHSGSCLGGHYTSMIKVDKNSWLNFNDRMVSQITNNLNDFYSKAYVLFYIKKKQ